MLRCGNLNGNNITYDKDISTLVSAILEGGIVEGFLVIGGSVSPGRAVLQSVRSNGETVLVSVENTSYFPFDTNGTKKVYITIDQGRLDDGSTNNADGTGIVSIASGANYPASNYIPLASINNGTITDERIFAKGDFVKRNENERISGEWIFEKGVRQQKYWEQIIHVSPYGSGDGTGRNGDNRMAFVSALKLNYYNHICTLVLSSGTYNLTIENLGHEFVGNFDILYIIGENRDTTEIVCQSGALNGYNVIAGIGTWGNIFIVNIKITTFGKNDTGLPWNYYSSAAFRLGSGSQFGFMREGSSGITIKDCIINSYSENLIFCRDIGCKIAFYNNAIAHTESTDLIKTHGGSCPVIISSEHTNFSSKLITQKVGQSIITNITDPNLVDFWIRLGTDGEASAGTSNEVAITPKQVKDNYELKTKLLQFTRGANLADETVVYNHSLGRTPKSIIFEMGFGAGSRSNGTAIGTGFNNGTNKCITWLSSGSYDYKGYACISLNGYQEGYVSAWDSTTFSITWIKGGNFPGNMYILATLFG